MKAMLEEQSSEEEPEKKKKKHKVRKFGNLLDII